MKKTLLLLTAGIIVGVGASQASIQLRAATGPAVYNVYEANIKDVDGYEKALPEVGKFIKESGGVRVAGGFNKSKTMRGVPVGNRFVIVRWDDMAAYEKGQSMGIKAWVDKYAPDAREIVTEGVEAK